MGFSKCLGFVQGTIAEHFIQKKKKKISRSPRQILKWGKMAEVEDGCEKWIQQILFSLFPKLKCPGEKEGYLYMEKLL